MFEREYVLKHRDEDIIEFTIDPVSKFVDNIYVFPDTKFNPINSKASEGGKIASFNNWLNNRCISDSRDGAEYLKKNCKIDNLKELMIIQYGLSLSDHYWIDRKPFTQKWKDINLFENRYSETIGNILFDKNIKIVGNIEYGINPDTSTGGNLKKKWIFNKEENKNYLIKGSGKLYKQEPFNEYFAHLLLEKLGFKHTSYTIFHTGSEYVSICPCIADTNTEMISAEDIRRKYGLGKTYEALIDLSAKKACLDYTNEINKMIIIDYLIDNTDRHWNNFGILRDTFSGAWIGAIPIFDNGYSLWNNDFVNNDKYSESQSFKEYNIDNMNYFNMYNYVKKIPDMESLFNEAFDKYENQERKNSLKKGILGKQEEVIKYLENEKNTRRQ
jgi:hypothetical protein